MNFDTWVIGEYGTTITDPKILALMDSAWQAARRTVSGQEAKPAGYMNIRGLTQLANGGYAIINPASEGDATHALYAAPIPVTEPKEPK